MLEPVRKTRVYEDIVSQIQRLIAEGRLCPGDQLPPERELAEIFRVSRTSVRDALRVLEMMGLIESRHGDGTYVKEITIDTLVAPLASILTAKKGLLAELLDARKIFEPQVARYAAERASPEDIARLEEIVRRQAEQVAAGCTAIQEDSAFHYALAVAARNQVILRMVDVIMDLLQECREQALQGEDRPLRSLAAHRRILEAVRRHDGAAAAAAMLCHIEEVESLLLEAPSRDPSSAKGSP